MENDQRQWWQQFNSMRVHWWSTTGHVHFFMDATAAYCLVSVPIRMTVMTRGRMDGWLVGWINGAVPLLPIIMTMMMIRNCRCSYTKKQNSFRFFSQRNKNLKNYNFLLKANSVNRHVVRFISVRKKKTHHWKEFFWIFSIKAKELYGPILFSMNIFCMFGETNELH